jgi:hypothetical protein
MLFGSSVISDTLGSCRKSWSDTTYSARFSNTLFDVLLNQQRGLKIDRIAALSLRLAFATIETDSLESTASFSDLALGPFAEGAAPRLRNPAPIFVFAVLVAGWRDA